MKPATGDRRSDAAAARRRLRAAIRQLAAKGWSAGKIAERHGVTRSLVAGLGRRMGVTFLGQKTLAARRKGAALAAKPAPSRPARAAAAATGPARPRGGQKPPPHLAGVALLDLKAEHCRAPLWGNERPDAAALRFCGRRVAATGASYCPDHAREFYLPRRSNPQRPHGGYAWRGPMR